MLVSGPYTEVKQFNCIKLEVCRDRGAGRNNTNRSKPPWWVVRYKGMYWSNKEWCYCWLVYGGPPEIFLTKGSAEIRAKAFRKQYGGGKIYDDGPLIVEILKIDI